MDILCFSFIPDCSLEISFFSFYRGFWYDFLRAGFCLTRFQWIWDFATTIFHSGVLLHPVFKNIILYSKGWHESRPGPSKPQPWWDSTGDGGFLCFGFYGEWGFPFFGIPHGAIVASQYGVHVSLEMVGALWCPCVTYWNSWSLWCPCVT